MRITFVDGRWSHWAVVARQLRTMVKQRRSTRPMLTRGRRSSASKAIANDGRSGELVRFARIPPEKRILRRDGTQVGCKRDHIGSGELLYARPHRSATLSRANPVL